MINLRSVVSELVVKDLSDPESDKLKYLVAYRDKLFIFDDDSNLSSIKIHFRAHHPGMEGDWSPLSTNDPYELASQLGEASPDIVAGEYHPEVDSLHLFGGVDLDPLTSLTLKKVVNKLGIRNVSMSGMDATTGEEDMERDYSPRQMAGGVPKIVYHGTYSPELNSILKYGLDPNRGPSKWSKQGIYHSEHIFFTANFDQAKYYAMNAVRNMRSSEDTYPIIIELEIPDLSLLYPDFDADRYTTQPRYYADYERDKYRKSAMKSMGLSREIGKWAYKGRIPAKFIRWVYYYLPYEKKWKKSRPETWKKLLWKTGDDWYMIAHKLGLFFPEDI